MKYVGTFGSGFQTVIKDILEGSNISLNKLVLFKIDNKLSVLINGKKANVYLLTK